MSEGGFREYFGGYPGSPGYPPVYITLAVIDMFHRHIASEFTALLFSVNCAFACSSLEKPPTIEKLFAKATTVFVAHVVRTQETDLKVEGIPIVEGEFRLLEIIKGTPPQDYKVRDFVYGYGNCSLGLLAGLDYVFFLQEEWGDLVVFPSGSQMLISPKGRASVEHLQKLRRLQEESSKQ